jgi:quercetin dioxygenase-like cupin family protein
MHGAHVNSYLQEYHVTKILRLSTTSGGKGQLMKTRSNTAVAAGAYTLRRGVGVIDVWWPYMPQAGRYTTKVAAEQTEGRLCQLHINDARGAAPPLHLHRDADETFYVIDGDISFFVNEERTELGAGDFICVPKGVPHTYLVQSEQAEFLVAFAPAGVEGFFAELGIEAVAGHDAPLPAVPDPAEFARRADAYEIEVLGPPPTLTDGRYA